MLEGKLVILRQITADDTDHIVNWRNNPAVRQNFIYREPFTREMHEKWLAEKVSTGEVLQYVIEEKKTGIPVGSVYLRDIDLENGKAEFGIFIGEDIARGKGLGTEATKIFVDYAKTLGLNELFLRLILGNTAAHECYLKAGFEDEREEPSFSSDGEAINVIFMKKALR